MENKFEKELEELLNRHCAENQSNTPDFILASYLLSCLRTFNLFIIKRDYWYNVHLEPANSFFINNKKENA
jgi:hypothetical protein